MKTMKVYIKPWVEALEEAKKHEGFVNFFPDHFLTVQKFWAFLATRVTGGIFARL